MTFNLAIAVGIFGRLAARWSRRHGKSYRPERHYMRGPGPQWHAKHGALVAVSQSATASPAAKSQSTGR
jgi:hypothetical protein